MGYTIRQVVELTGASEFLLRIWENRYQAFSPQRTKTGRRIYGEKDVLKARALVQLTHLGLRVGQLGQLSLASLQDLIEAQADQQPQPEGNPLVHKIMTQVHQYDWNGVRASLVTARRSRTGLEWINSLILPLLAEMASQSDSGRLAIAKERILAAAIEENLILKLKKSSRTKKGPRIVFATPEGDFHDLGLRIASFIASELGVDALFLGSHIPHRELSEVCLRFKATHLVLTSTPSRTSPRGSDYLKYVNFLDRHLPSGVAVWLAGRNALVNAVNLKRKFLILNSFTEYQEELQKCLK